MVSNERMEYGSACWVIRENETQKLEREKRVMAMEVPGNRRGRPKRRWIDSIRKDLSHSLSERELSREDAQDRAKWRRLIRHIDPT